MNDDEIKGNEKKAKFFYDGKKAIHVTYNNGSWHNGYIIEFFGDGFILDEFKKGTLPVFYIQVKDIEPYTIKKEVEDGTGN